MNFVNSVISFTNHAAFVCVVLTCITTLCGLALIPFGKMEPKGKGWNKMMGLCHLFILMAAFLAFVPKFLSAMYFTITT